MLYPTYSKMLHQVNKDNVNPSRGRKYKLFFPLFLFVFLLILPAVPYCAEKLADKDIQRAVETNLILDENIPAHLIDVSVKNGVATLAGSVDSLFTKKRALKKTHTIKGVTAVINLLEIRPLLRDDKQIKEDVTTALLKDPATDSYEIKVSVENGIVNLTGIVDSWSEKILTENVAAQVKGVRKIQTEGVLVEPKTRRSDNEIRQDIVGSMDLDVYLNNDLVTVGVKDGVVHLQGSVASLADKIRAEMNAYVAGVKEVDTEQLLVQYWLDDTMRRKNPQTLRGDMEIKKAVNNALKYDPRVFEFNIDTDVTSGLVTLSGVVDNLRSKRAAEKDARNTTGVWSVKNLIKVRPLLSTPLIGIDIAISADIKNALARDYLLDPEDISYSVFNQKVTLNGVVDYRYKKILAEDIVAAIPGVVAVQNNLDVSSKWEWRNDAAIKLDVEEEFLWSILVDGEDLDVSSDNGVVTLSGEVSDWGELKAAVNNCFEGGAREVKTRLTIENTDMTSFQTFYHPFQSYFPFM